jgi:hypothetical protein
VSHAPTMSVQVSPQRSNNLVQKITSGQGSRRNTVILDPNIILTPNNIELFLDQELLGNNDDDSTI